MKFKFEIDSGEGMNLKSFYLLIPLMSSVKSFCQFYIPSLITIDSTTDNHKQHKLEYVVSESEQQRFNPGNEIYLQGSLDVTQTRALQCPYFMRNIKSHIHYPQLNNNASLEQFSIKSLRDEMMKNSIFLGFKQLSKLSMPGSLDNVTIQLELNVNEVSIRYHYTLWQKVNSIWVQYVAIFLIFYKIAVKLVEYTFNHQYLIAWKVEPWKKLT